MTIDEKIEMRNYSMALIEKPNIYYHYNQVKLKHTIISQVKKYCTHKWNRILEEAKLTYLPHRKEKIIIILTNIHYLCHH